MFTARARNPHHLACIASARFDPVRSGSVRSCSGILVQSTVERSALAWCSIQASATPKISSGSMPALSSSLDANWLRNTRIRSRGDKSPFSKTSSRRLTPTCFLFRGTRCSLTEGGKRERTGSKSGIFRWHAFPGLYSLLWRPYGIFKITIVMTIVESLSTIPLHTHKGVPRLEHATSEPPPPTPPTHKLVQNCHKENGRTETDAWSPAA